MSATARTPRRALVGLGANLGDAAGTLREALKAIGRIEGVMNVKASRFYATSPVDAGGPDYVNAVALLETTLTPEVLLCELQAIEKAFGRVRPKGVVNAPRTMDLDLLRMDGETRETEVLTLPHPRMTGRLFVLVPWLDVEPDAMLPDGRSVRDAVEALRASDPSQQIRVL
ncbi:MAG: 2-amino-4-hydroxy-6-hydroxymethyldihydropteridine diphosphokinase [Sutterella parvirubra]|nr:2-amino-4-hydroxy-6-hydroxymethyldihydropteridine diphosphokinase [Sutterella parvirubra]